MFKENIEAINKTHKYEISKHENTIKDKSNHISQLKQQKDELLDFVEKNSVKTKQLDDKTNLLQCKYELIEKENLTFKEKIEDMQKQKINQDELLG